MTLDEFLKNAEQFMKHEPELDIYEFHADQAIDNLSIACDYIHTLKTQYDELAATVWGESLPKFQAHPVGHHATLQEAARDSLDALKWRHHELKLTIPSEHGKRT